LLNLNTLPDSWKKALEEEFNKEYFDKLVDFYNREILKSTVFPKSSELFNAYRSTEFKNVKVVILGQDPYHGINQSHGLAFSVNNSVVIPPSLRNIFKELVEDMGCNSPTNGNLNSWANQGVLLLNTVLSVRDSEPNSHKGYGWEYFTDATINVISNELNNIVFILWGKPAQNKIKLIDESKHLVLKAPHPSPLSSYRGFFGSRPFSKTNDYLLTHGVDPINWCLD